MNKLNFVLMSCLTLISIQRATAAEDLNYDRSYAVGGAYTLNWKTQGTDPKYVQHSGEVFGYTYHRLNENFILRPGIRFGMTPGQEPTLIHTGAIGISETDIKSTGEISIIWTRYFLMPAFTFGGGAIYRTTSLYTKAPILSSQSSISGTSLLPFIQGQASVIIPIPESKFEVAPFARYTHIFSDSRLSWYFGIEGSIALF